VLRECPHPHSRRHLERFEKLGAFLLLTIMDHCGILYNAYDGATDTFSPAQVPLEEVKIKVWIVDGA
jgi:hypothetical protein